MSVQGLISVYGRAQRALKTASRAYDLAENDFLISHERFLPPSLFVLARERIRQVYAYVAKRREQLAAARGGVHTEKLLMLARESGQIGAETYLDKTVQRLKIAKESYDLCLQHVTTLQSEALLFGSDTAQGPPTKFRSPMMQELVDGQKEVSCFSWPLTGTHFVKTGDENYDEWVEKKFAALQPGDVARIEWRSIGAGITGARVELQVSSSKQQVKGTAKDRDVFSRGRRWIVVAPLVEHDSKGGGTFEWTIPTNFFAESGCKPHGKYSFRITAVMGSGGAQPAAQTTKAEVAPILDNSAHQDADIRSPAAADSLLMADWLNEITGIYSDSPSFAIGELENAFVADPVAVLNVDIATLDGSVVDHPEWEVHCIVDFVRLTDGKTYITEREVGRTPSVHGPSPLWHADINVAAYPSSENPLVRFRLKQTGASKQLGEAVVPFQTLQQEPVVLNIITHSQQALSQGRSTKAKALSGISNVTQFGRSKIAQLKNSETAERPETTYVVGTVTVSRKK